MNLDVFLTPTELSGLMDITVQALYKQLREFGIEATKVGSRRRLYPHHMREYIKLKGLHVPKMVISLSIVKGGVGKTTFAHALSVRASAYGLRTLAIDLDQQANLTSSFGVYATHGEVPTLMDAVRNKTPIRDTIVSVTDFLHVIPSNLHLANLDFVLGSASENPGSFLKDLIGPIRNDYDVIFIDCPPSLTRPIVAAHCFSDKIVMPVLVDKFSMDGIQLAFEHLESVIKNYKLEPDVLIAINKYDARHKLLSRKMINLLVSKYGDFMLDSYVGVSKQIDNLVASGRSLWDGGRSKMPVLQDFDDLTVELLGLSRWRGGQHLISSSPPPQELAML